MCYDPWEHSPEKMGLDWLGHIMEVERGRNVATNRWKATGFLEAIEEKYNDDDEFDEFELEDEVERLRALADSNPQWLPVLEKAEQALKARADAGTMAA